MTEQEKYQDRRRSFRTSTSIAAVAKTTLGSAQAVEISDLSAEGCAVKVNGHPFAAGAVYGLKINGMESLVSTARWAAGQGAGLLFDRPLHPAIADHIAALHPPPDPSDAES